MNESIVSRHQRALPPAVQAPTQIPLFPRKPAPPLGIRKNLVIVFIFLFAGLAVYTLTSVITLVNAYTTR